MQRKLAVLLGERGVPVYKHVELLRLSVESARHKVYTVRHHTEPVVKLVLKRLQLLFLFGGVLGGVFNLLVALFNVAQGFGLVRVVPCGACKLLRAVVQAAQLFVAVVKVSRKNCYPRNERSNRRRYDSRRICGNGSVKPFLRSGPERCICGGCLYCRRNALDGSYNARHGLYRKRRALVRKKCVYTRLQLRVKPSKQRYKVCHKAYSGRQKPRRPLRKIVRSRPEVLPELVERLVQPAVLNALRKA